MLTAEAVAPFDVAVLGVGYWLVALVAPYAAPLILLACVLP